MDLTGKTILNHKVISRIGEGGMGFVFLAEHLTLKRRAAIKVLNPIYSSNQEIKIRFLNEAVTLAQLNHNNIVTLYDFANIGRNLYLLMEYAEGEPLDDYLEFKHGLIPENRCKEIFKKILSGFSYTHKKNVIHRDIKPSNIMLGSDDNPKILDFGIAKIITSDSTITNAGTRIGTVMYMSPEQVHGETLDFRSDIYSLGVTLFEMLTGKRPYDDTTDSEYTIQTKILTNPLPSPSSIYPSITRHIESIIYKATSKSPEDRFQSCKEFIEAIDSPYFVFSPLKWQIPETDSNKDPVYHGRNINKPLSGIETIPFIDLNSVNSNEAVEEEINTISDIDVEQSGSDNLNTVISNVRGEKPVHKTELVKNNLLKPKEKKFSKGLIFKVSGAGAFLILLIYVIYRLTTPEVIIIKENTIPENQKNNIESSKKDSADIEAETKNLSKTSEVNTDDSSTKDSKSTKRKTKTTSTKTSSEPAPKNPEPKSSPKRTTFE